MITLAFDTSAKIASCAVLDGKKVLSEYSIDNGLTQSELIMPMAENMLAALKLDFSDIGLIATSVGPGSFTGVRIGVSMAKGLAFGRDIRIAPVSTLEALCENLVPFEGILVPTMDARRNQVYNALFECKGGKVERLTEDRAISLSQLCEELGEIKDKRIYLSGDGYCVTAKALEAAGIRFEKTPDALIPESAASVGKVGIRMYEAGLSVSDKELLPKYLRLPQAERERLERQNAQK